MCVAAISEEDLQRLDDKERALLRAFASSRLHVAEQAGRADHSAFWGGLVRCIDRYPGWRAEMEAKFAAPEG